MKWKISVIVSSPAEHADDDDDGGSSGSVSLAQHSRVKVQQQRPLLSQHASRCSIPPGFESIVCARGLPSHETLDQELQVANTQVVGVSELLKDAVSVDGGSRGSAPSSADVEVVEQQQVTLQQGVANVCEEKPTVPASTYRRTIGQGHNSWTWGQGHYNGSM